MERNRLTITQPSLLLYACLGLFVIRDCLRVLRGRFVFGLNGWEFERFTGSLMTLLAVLAIVLLVLYVALYIHTRLSFRLRCAIYTIGVLTIFWTIHSLITVPGYNIGTLDGTAKTIWICMFGLYLGYDEQTWIKIKRIIPFLASLYMLLSFGYVIYIRFNGMWRQQTNQAPYWMTYSTAIWLLAYLAFCYENNKRKDSNRLLILFVMNAFIIAFTISRGWLLQTVFMMVMFVITSSSSKKSKRRLIISLIAVLAIGTYVLRQDISLYITSYITKFRTAASRESQYVSFFSQVSFGDLLLGKGEYASYVYRNVQNYIYIDNSFLYYAFHFGSLFSVVLLIMELTEAVKVLRVSKNIQDRKIGLILFMWIAALMGASVFCAGYEVSLRVLFIMILIGRSAFVTDQYRLGQFDSEI